MKLTILTENNSVCGGAYFQGEAGASYHIEDEGCSILLDTGYSDLFMKNAEKLGIDLGDLDGLVFSHGHDDHTSGFQYFVEKPRRKKLVIVAHPEAFAEKRLDGEQIGSPVSKEKAAEAGRLVLTKTPFKLNRNLTFLGEIPQTVSFEERYSLGTTVVDGVEREDFMMDDSALVYKGEKGIYVITCCSHSGIVNIIEYAKKVTGEERVLGVIGGFHLFDDSAERVRKTADYLAAQRIEELYPCHCTSFGVKAVIHQKIKVKEACVGLVLNWK